MMHIALAVIVNDTAEQVAADVIRQRSHGHLHAYSLWSMYNQAIPAGAVESRMQLPRMQLYGRLHLREPAEDDAGANEPVRRRLQLDLRDALQRRGRSVDDVI
ncbi:hypothetical protein D3C73_536080 [compost metagenome]